MPDESVVSRVKKLLALALNNSNEAEASAAMAKARALMLEHAVEEFHLRGADAKTGVEIFEFRNNRKFQSWMQLAFLGVSKLFDARVLITQGREYDVAVFICADYDLELLKETTYHVIATILREAAIQTRGLAAANSFRAGAAQGFLDAATYLQKQAREAESSGSGDEVTSLVTQRRNTVDTETKKLFPNTQRHVINATASDVKAYYAGKEVGGNLGKAQRKIE